MKKSSFRKTLLLIILLVAFLSVNSLVFPQETKPFLGTWKGSLNVMGQELEIIVKLSLSEKKEIQGTIDVPQQPGAVDVPLGSFTIEGKKITGSFIQSGAEGTFNMAKE